MLLKTTKITNVQNEYVNNFTEEVLIMLMETTRKIEKCVK